MDHLDSAGGGPPAPHLSLASQLGDGVLGGAVRAGAGAAVGAHVGEPVGQPLVLDGQPQLLLDDGREVGEVVQGERPRRGQAGDEGGAADVSQRGARVLQHHSGGGGRERTSNILEPRGETNTSGNQRCFSAEKGLK